MDTLTAAATSPTLADTLARHPGAVLLAAVAVMVWTAAYAAACAFWPFANCRRCDGSGKRRSPSGRAFRTCPRCRGTARRLRTGRRVFNWLSARRKEDTPK